MKKMNKKILTLLIIMSISTTGGILLLGNTGLSEPTTPSTTAIFDMSGASIRYKESESATDNGIKFGVHADKATYNRFVADENAVAGTLIIPTDLLDGETLTLDNEDAINVVTHSKQAVEQAENITATVWAENKDGYMEATAYLTGIPKTSYNRELTAVGYIDWDGDGTDVQYTHDNASEDVNSVAVTNLSIADVALAVMELPATTEAQKTELKNYINNYTVTFIYAYGNADEQTVAYGSEFTAPEDPAERDGYNFLGWFERENSAELKYAETATDFTTADLTVKQHKEYIAKFKAVGPVYQKPAVSDDIYSNLGSGFTVTSDSLVQTGDQGAVFFKSAEVAQGEAFMMYADLAKMEENADGVGFAVGTLANNNANHMLFDWRWKSNDIYVVRMENKSVASSWSWKGFDSSDTGNPGPDLSCSVEQKASNLVFVYNNNTYYMFIDGKLVMGISETTEVSWNGGSIASIIGAEGAKKIGLSVLGSVATFSDWGYTTDATKIAAFLGSLAKPIVDTDIYSSATSIYQNGELTLSSANNGAFFFEGIEIEQDADFMIYAELSKEALVAGGGVGFVVGTRGDANANHVLFNWRPGQKDIYVSREKNGEAWGWKGFETSPSCNVEKSEETIKMTLIYKKGTYYMFLNDTKVLEISETTKFSWSSATIADIVGETGTVKVGPSTIFGSATFTDWGYTTDATEITDYLAKITI